MNPWDVLGWLLVAIVAIIVLALLTIVILLAISLAQFLHDERKKHNTVLKKIEAIDPGKEVEILGVPWTITQVDTDYDIDYDQYKLHLALRTDRDNMVEKVIR